MEERRIYRHRRRRRLLPYVLVTVVAVLGAGLVYELVGLPDVQGVIPSRDGYVATPSPTILVNVNALDKLADLHVSLDGKDVTAKAVRDGDRLSIAAGWLADGVHRMRLRGESSNLLRGTLDERWSFTVDTQSPQLKLDADVADGSISSSPAVISGTTDPGAMVSAHVETVPGQTDSAAPQTEAVSATAIGDADGKFSLALDVPEGPLKVSLSATDEAGNQAAKYLSAYVDATPPTLYVHNVAPTVHRTTFTIKVSARDTLRPPKLSVQLDGAAVALHGPAAAARLPLEDLSEGRHLVVFTASDGGGNVVKRQRAFVVDSTERFGVAELWPGARGKDVTALQSALIDRGVYQGHETGVYNATTAAAVKQFQEIVGMPVTGKVDDTTLVALSRRVVVDLSQLRLFLYQGDQLLRSYPVAAGQPAYPTPTGSYRVVSKVMNPTWYPPNSDWAKDAKPIPPGIANPLGTRWIGTSAPGVGIHGTPDDASIGTHASHGCIRMHIPDVEALFPDVVIGMRVVIQS